jgi:hypothetical protein
VFAALAFVGVSAASRTAAASPCPVDPAIGPASTVLATLQPDERTAFLRTRIDTAARRSRIWAASWGAGLGALTIGQLAIAPAVPRADRIDFWVGAVASGIGALSRVVFLPAVLRERRRLARLPRNAGRCDRLAAHERAVAASAKGERQGRALWMHGLTLAYNAGVGLVLGLAFHRPVPANRLAAIGAVIGEVMVVTQPTVMLRTLDDYRAGRLFGPGTWRPRPLVLRGGGGIGLTGGI